MKNLMILSRTELSEKPSCSQFSWGDGLVVEELNRKELSGG